MSKINNKCEDLGTIYSFGMRLGEFLRWSENDLMYFVDIIENEVVCQEEAKEVFRITCIELDRIFKCLRRLKVASTKYLTDEEINKFMVQYSTYF